MFLSDGSLTGSTFSRFSKCAILPLAIRMPNARSPGIVFVYFFLATLAAASVLSRLVAWLFWTSEKCPAEAIGRRSRGRVDLLCILHARRRGRCGRGTRFESMRNTWQLRPSIAAQCWRG